MDLLSLAPYLHLPRPKVQCCLRTFAAVLARFDHHSVLSQSRTPRRPKVGHKLGVKQNLSSYSWCDMNGSNSEKACFMFFQRGPRAFIQETVQLINNLRSDGLSLRHFSQSVPSYIVERITVLDCLNFWQSQVYLEIARQT